MEEGGFKTLKGYGLENNSKVTYAMEDYIEMIYRSTKGDSFIRMGEIAGLLNVKPSSASKMAVHMREQGLINYEKYGYIYLTEKGSELGEYLLFRHEVLRRFFELINGRDFDLKELEQIEHYLSKKTVLNIDSFINKIESEY